MATLELKGESIECETTGFRQPTFEIEVSFNTPETDEGYLKGATIKTSADSRSDCTFGYVQEQINEHFAEHYPDMEVTDISSIRVIEKTIFKAGYDLD